MVEQVPLTRTTREIIDQAREREAALARVDELMAAASGTAHDLDNQVEMTVDARGKLLRLWLAPAAVSLGHHRLGALIVEVAAVAMREATQDSYNKVALLLGSDMTQLIEELSGMPAPARAENDDPGMTVEEFQRQRELRLAGSGSAGVPATAPQQDDEEDWTTFDPASLRSDR